VRLASAPSRPVYDANEATGNPASKKSGKKSGSPRLSATVKAANTDKAKHKPTEPVKNLEAIQQSWTSWQPVAPPPIRDEAGVFHFKSHGEFTPNKSPEEMLREGCFGGSYFRPLYSKHLDTIVSDDYKEIPASWIDGLNVDLYLTSPTYDPEINKFKVTCGQSIEQWELAGWINHTYDVRGWFQWYCRFFMGRRCADDDRQVARWKKCVGATGRWRRMLLKKYRSVGVRDVFNEGADEEQQEVGPVMHQTCHHWAFCVTQEVLDEYWSTGN